MIAATCKLDSLYLTVVSMFMVTKGMGQNSPFRLTVGYENEQSLNIISNYTVNPSVDKNNAKERGSFLKIPISTSVRKRVPS